MAIQFLNTVQVDTSVLYVDTANDKVGIGTDSPSYKLDVNGNVQLQATLYVRTRIQGLNSVGSYSNLILNDLGANVGIGTASPFSTAKLQVKTATDKNLAIQTGTTNTTGIKINAFNDAGSANIPLELNGSILSLKTGETEKMRITSAGNVGIGTTSPDAKLEVAGGTTGILLSNLGDSSAYDAIRMTYSGYNSGIPEFIFEPKTAPGSGTVNSYFRFQTRPNGGAAGTGNVANVTVDGKVGIGTQTPGSKLSIDSVPQDALSINSSDGDGPYAVWRRQNGTLGFVGNANALSLSGNTNFGVRATNDLVFAAGGASEKMRIDSTGNVMIGNTNASAKLDIRQDTGYALRTENASGSTFRVEADTGNIEAAGSVKMGDDSDAASATKVGTMRYRTGTEYVEVTGTELITNGDFASSTDWVLKNSASINNGTGVATVPGAGALGATNGNWSLSQASVFAVSTLYRVRFQARRDAGTASEMYVGQSYNLIFNQVLTTAWVEHEVVFTSTSNAGWSNLSFGGVVGTTSEVKEVSVMEVTSEDASYADMCMQTGASTYEWVNIVRNTY